MNSDRPSSEVPLHRKVLYGLTNWSLFVAGLVNLGVGTWSAAHEQAAIAATSLTAGLVLLFAATIDRFESLKGLGIEAKTRQLDQKIEQTDDALRRLRELTELIGASLIDMNSKIGRWDSAPGPRESHALAQKVRAIMSALGSDSPAIAATLRPWTRILCHDLAAVLIAPLYKAMSEKLQKLEAARSEIPKPMDVNNPEFLRLTAEIDAGNSYVGNRLRTIHQFEMNDYPERFMSLFEDIPLLGSDEIRPVREKASKFAEDMRALRQSLTLPNAEAWFFELEEARKQQQ